MKLDLTYFELAAIAKGLALLQERIQEPAHQRHAPAVGSMHEKLLRVASEADCLEAKA